MGLSNTIREIVGLAFLGFIAYVWVTNRAMGIRACSTAVEPDVNIVKALPGRHAAVAEDFLLLRPSQAPEATPEMLLRPAGAISDAASELVRPWIPHSRSDLT